MVIIPRATLPAPLPPFSLMLLPAIAASASDISFQADITDYAFVTPPLLFSLLLIFH
jgi:hypothetical protein